jgi:hypothetical protein
MMIGPPRSGTTWASVWLEAIHDPLWDCYYQDLDKKFGGSGICCTGLGLFPDWVNEHPCPKVILHRPAHEVKVSCIVNHLPIPPAIIYKNLDRIKGMHVAWTELFSDPEPIYRHLIGDGFDAAKHLILCYRNIQEDNRQRRDRANPYALKMLRKSLDRSYLM